MHLFPTIFLTLLLLLVIYQDFRYRGVSWFLFPVIAIISIIVSLQNNLPLILVKYSLINSGIILFQIAGLTLYFSLRLKKWTNITKTYLGWGDILFFFCITPLFSPVNFIAFMVIATILTLLISLSLQVLSKNRSLTIPLAGALSIVLVPFLLQLLWKSHFNLHNDLLLIQILNLNV